MEISELVNYIPNAYFFGISQKFKDFIKVIDKNYSEDHPMNINTKKLLINTKNNSVYQKLLQEI